MIVIHVHRDLLFQILFGNRLLQDIEYKSLCYTGSQRRKWQPTPVLLPGKFHGLGSLVGYSPWGHKELDTTE